MQQRLKRIAPWPAGKIGAVFYALLGLVTGAVSLAGYFQMPAGMREDEMAPGAAVALAVALPFLYALAGLLMGMLAAWLYNLAAGWTGGLEIELSVKPSPAGEDPGTAANRL